MLPNGANRQVIRWIVVNDPDKVHRIAEMTIDWMKIVKEKAPALYEGSQPGGVCLCVGWRPGSHFPGSAMYYHGLCSER